MNISFNEKTRCNSIFVKSYVYFINGSVIPSLPNLRSIRGLYHFNGVYWRMRLSLRSRKALRGDYIMGNRSVSNVASNYNIEKLVIS